MEMAEAPPSELRIVLLGWTDSGKTSSANTILDKEAFCTEKGTEECEKQGGFVDGRQVTVVDTQGWKRIASLTFFRKEIVRGVELCPPGPHALLLVMRLDKDVETDSLQELLGLLSTRVWNCTIVLFTHGDAVGGMTDLERRIQKKDVYKQLLEKCGHRYHVFDNNKRGRDQVTELLKKIDKMVEGNTERFLPSKEIHTVFITQQLTQRRKSINQPPSMKDETSESKSPSEEKSDVTEAAQKGPQAEGTEVEEEQNVETGGTPGAKRRDSIDTPPEMKDETSESKSPSEEKSDATEAAQMSEVPPASTPESELRLVLLGRTGSGKSAAGNTILGEETFESQASSSPVTQETKKKKEVIAGRKVALVDTADWFTPGLSEKQIEDDIGLCYSLSSPGPHAFLLVVPVGRYIDREKEQLDRMLKIFGEASLGHTMILFTHGDELENSTIEEFIQTGTEDLKWLIEQCGHRYHVLNNHVLKDNTQVDELLQKVDEMINKHNGKSFCSEKYRAVESHIKHVQKHLLMERRKQENTEEELSKQKKELKNIQIELNECKQRLEQQKKDIDNLKEELRNEREQNKEKQRLLHEAQEEKRKEEIKLKELGERYKKVKENYNELEKLRQAEEEKAREDAERHRDTLLRLSEITAESTTVAQQLRDKEEERKRLETEMEKMQEACHEKDRKIEGLRQTELEKNREIDRLTQIEEQKDREIDRLTQIEEQKDREVDRLTQIEEQKDREIDRLKQMELEKDREMDRLKQIEEQKNREIDRLKQMELEKDREMDRLKQTEEQKDEAMDRLRQDNKKKDEIIKRLEADLESARTIAAQATAVMQESEQSSRGETREEQIQRGRDSLQSLRSIAQRLSTLQQEISGNLDVQEGEDREDITPQRP